MTLMTKTFYETGLFIFFIYMSKKIKSTQKNKLFRNFFIKADRKTQFYNIVSFNLFDNDPS